MGQYPVDILHRIASFITNSADLCSFAHCNTTTWAMGEEKLWKVDMDRETPGKPALYWAIEHKDLALAEKALAKYTESQALGLIDGTVVRWDTFAWRDGTPANERLSPPVILAVESGSKDMLDLVLEKALAVGCGLDGRRERTEGLGGWHVHECCDIELCLGRCFNNSAHRLWCLLPDPPSPNICESAMHLAVWKGRPDMLRLLFDYGVKRRGCKEWSDDVSESLACKFRLVDSVNARAKGKFKQGFKSFYSHSAHTTIVQILSEGIDVWCLRFFDLGPDPADREGTAYYLLFKAPIIR
jgi:hypothetical protein